MSTFPITFEQIFKCRDWKPIRNCPGRFMLIGGRSSLPIDEIAGTEIEVKKFKSKKAPDEILVVRFASGGLISYFKPDGTFLHTLNTEDGLIRKLAQLEISLPDTDL